jgi:hypothetical protein
MPPLTTRSADYTRGDRSVVRATTRVWGRRADAAAGYLCVTVREIRPAPQRQLLFKFAR